MINIIYFFLEKTSIIDESSTKIVGIVIYRK